MKTLRRLTASAILFLAAPTISFGAPTTSTGRPLPSGNTDTSGFGTGNTDTSGSGTGNTDTGGFGTGNTDTCGFGTGNTLVNPLKVCSLRELLDLILRAAIDIGTIILVLALVWVGFLFVAARGNEEKLRNARAALFWTVIGGLILLGARGLSAVIQSTATNLGS